MCEIDELIHEDLIPTPDPISGLDPIPAPDPISGSDPIPTPDPIPDPDPIPTPDPIPDSEQSNSLGTDSDIYNEHKNDDDTELGSCDCRSECRYNTGDSGKYSKYGFWD